MANSTVRKVQEMVQKHSEFEKLMSSLNKQVDDLIQLKKTFEELEKVKKNDTGLTAAINEINKKITTLQNTLENGFTSMDDIKMLTKMQQESLGASAFIKRYEREIKDLKSQVPVLTSESADQITSEFEGKARQLITKHREQLEISSEDHKSVMELLKESAKKSEGGASVTTSLIRTVTNHPEQLKPGEIRAIIAVVMERDPTHPVLAELVDKDITKLTQVFIAYNQSNKISNARLSKTLITYLQTESERITKRIKGTWELAGVPTKDQGEIIGRVRYALQKGFDSEELRLWQEGLKNGKMIEAYEGIIKARYENLMKDKTLSRVLNLKVIGSIEGSPTVGDFIKNLQVYAVRQ
ncbi:MAG: hypothetical protein PHS02_02930, partial [Candidatus ainarchaeum sp.]|nr:hypothetical protein [Candidatus ainarchaeum sp.]